MRPVCVVALICPHAPCSWAEFPSISAEHLQFHCSLPSALPDVFQKSRALTALDGNPAKRGDDFASENEIPEDCRGRRISLSISRCERGRDMIPAIRLDFIQSYRHGREVLGKAVHQLSCLLVTIPFWSSLQLAWLHA